MKTVDEYRELINDYLEDVYYSYEIEVSEDCIELLFEVKKESFFEAWLDDLQILEERLGAHDSEIHFDTEEVTITFWVDNND